MAKILFITAWVQASFIAKGSMPIWPLLSIKRQMFIAPIFFYFLDCSNSFLIVMCSVSLETWHKPRIVSLRVCYVAWSPAFPPFYGFFLERLANTCQPVLLWLLFAKLIYQSTFDNCIPMQCGTDKMIYFLNVSKQGLKKGNMF